MSDDSQLPAVQSQELRLDVATKKALRKVDFDPRIVDAVQSLAKVGINISPGSSAGYVIASYYERMEGLRSGRKMWMDLARDAEREMKKLRKELKVTEGLEFDDPKDKDKVISKLEARIEKLVKDAAGYDMMHRNLGQSIGDTGKSILELEHKLKQPAPNSDDGNVSWDPDKPAQTVNLQVNVSGGAAVSVEGNE